MSRAGLDSRIARIVGIRARSVVVSGRSHQSDSERPGDPLACMKALSQNASPTVMIFPPLVTPKRKAPVSLNLTSSLPRRPPVSELGSFSSARRRITRGPMTSKRSDAPDVSVLFCDSQPPEIPKGGILSYLFCLGFLPDESLSDQLRDWPERSLQVFSRPRDCHGV